MEKRIKHIMDLSQDILDIKDIFKSNGFKLFIVGGAVRDSMLGIEPKDFDLATDAVPDKVEEMMFNANIKTIATGKAFGVINVFSQDNEFEIATFRADSGSDGRRPDTVTFTTIEGDVVRRDLTINALFFDIDTSEVVDLVNGLEDLKNSVIRTVGCAEDRFKEDRLRILRAIRFAARFCGTLDKDIIDALNEDSTLDKISAERIHDEFIKGIKSAKSVINFMELLNSFGMFSSIFPNMIIDNNFIEDNDPIIVISMLLKNETFNSLNKKLNKLTFSNTEVKQIECLLSLRELSFDTAVSFKSIIKSSDLSSSQIINFASKNNINMKLVNTLLKFELSIDGNDVMKEFNLKPSKELGLKIRELENIKFKEMLISMFMYF